MFRDRATLIDIYTAGASIVQSTQNLALDELRLDSTKLKAVLYDLIVIGEATKRLSPEFRDRHSEMPWKKMAGLRDVVVHQYDGIDFDLLWEAIKMVLPEVLKKLSLLIAANGDVQDDSDHNIKDI